MIGNTSLIIKKTGLDYFIIDSDHQIGNTFGERYSNAFQQVFNKGYDKVISIGNDCPGLTKGLLLNAAQKLSIYDVVVGPARDGGAYLIALTKSVFDEEKFSKLQWKSSHLLSNLHEYTDSFRGRIASLISLSDVDSSTELWRSVLQNGNSAFINQLKEILCLLREDTTKFFFSINSNYSTRQVGLRAPPVF